MTPGFLSERSGRLLAALVREYIATGEPVASSTLAQRPGLGVSSATVRALLARLEDEGYVRQPHTSAGRVPTDLGYRYYVDQLLEGRRSARSMTAVEARLVREAGGAALMDQMLSGVSRVLSKVSRHVGFALAPASDVTVFNTIDFIALSATKILVVLVSRGGQVTQKVIDVAEPISPDELQHAANYLNTEFSGRSLVEVRTAVLARLRQERTLYNTLLARALRLAHSSLEGPSPTSVFVEGTSSLLDDAERAPGHVTLETLRTLLQIIDEKQRLVRLLNEYIDSPGLTVVIGTEHAAPDLRAFSMVAATYSYGSTIGAIGIIGPTRMRYSRAIAAVDGAAHALERVLSGRN